MAKRGYSKAIHQQLYRYYDKEKMEDFQNKLDKDDITFQDFVSDAIDRYLEGNYNPKEEKE